MNRENFQKDKSSIGTLIQMAMNFSLGDTNPLFYGFLERALTDEKIFNSDTARETFIYPVTCTLKHLCDIIAKSSEFATIPKSLKDEFERIHNDLETSSNLNEVEQAGQKLICLLQRMGCPDDNFSADARKITHQLRTIVGNQSPEKVLRHLESIANDIETKKYDEDIFISSLIALFSIALESVQTVDSSKQSVADSEGHAQEKLKQMSTLNKKLLHRIVGLLEKVLKEKREIDLNLFIPLIREIDGMGLALSTLDRNKLRDLIAMIERIKTLTQREQEKSKKDSRSYEMELAVLRQRVKESEELAKKDPLTGVFNRRAFDEAIASYVEIAATEHIQLSLLLFDCDHFKEINDTHGHLVGDEYLKMTTRKIGHALRGDDFLARYGGDEFIAILPNCEPELSDRIARRLSEYLSATSIEILGTTFQMSLSMGLTNYVAGDTVKSIIERADKALYMAKRQGRNRLEFA